MASVAALLRGSGLPPLEARLLMAHALGVQRAWLAAHDTDEVPADRAASAGALFARRRAGEPVAYILGEREFYGRRFAVSPAVLIPRPETELLVDAALARIPAGGSVLELGTGSGALAITVALERPGVAVTACDISEGALSVARSNAAALGARVEWLRSDWFSALVDRSFHVVLCNPPYVAAGDPHLQEGDLRFEPTTALEADATGMGCIDKVAADARAHLVPGGWLCFEHGHDQGAACTMLLERLGYSEVDDQRDLAGHARIAIARFDPSRSGR